VVRAELWAVPGGLTESYDGTATHAPELRLEKYDDTVLFPVRCIRAIAGL